MNDLFRIYFFKKDYSTSCARKATTTTTTMKITAKIMTTTIGTTIIIVQSIPLFWAPFSVVELISSIIWDFVLASFSGSSWSIDFVLFDKGLPRADVAKRPTITSRQILTNSISLKFEVWILNFKIQIILKLCDLMKKIKKVFWCARAGNGNYFFFVKWKNNDFFLLFSCL